MAQWFGACLPDGKTPSRTDAPEGYDPGRLFSIDHPPTRGPGPGLTQPSRCLLSRREKTMRRQRVPKAWRVTRRPPGGRHGTRQQEARPGPEEGRWPPRGHRKPTQGTWRAGGHPGLWAEAPWDAGGESGPAPGPPTGTFPGATGNSLIPVGSLFYVFPGFKPNLCSLFNAPPRIFYIFW